MSEQTSTTSTTETPEQKMINIRDINGWLANNVKDKQQDDKQLPLLVRPSALRTLYTLFYYEYVRYSLANQTGEKKEIPKPENDTEINIPEQLFVLLLQIFFDQNSNTYFTNISNL